jgi:hypothetical protein
LYQGDLHNTLKDSENYIFNILKKIFNSRGSRVDKLYLVFDYGAPANKQKTQMKRDETKKDKCLSDEEILELFKLPYNELISKPELPIKRLLNTRSTMPFLIHFVTMTLINATSQKIQCKHPIEVEIISGIKSYSIHGVNKKNPKIFCNYQELQQNLKDFMLSVETEVTSFSLKFDPYQTNPTISESNPIWGEAEIKMVTLVMKEKNFKNFIIKSPDTDGILIWLLALKDCIEYDEQKDEFSKDIYIDLEIPPKVADKKDKIIRSFLSINALWKEIYVKFAMNYKFIALPIEFFCFCVIWCGTDYVDHIPGMDGEKFFDFFKNFAYDYIKNSKRQPIYLETLENVGNFAIEKKYIVDFSLFYDMMILYHINYPNRLQNDIKFQNIIKKKSQLISIEELRNIAPLFKAKHLPENKQEIQSHVIRTYWNFLYISEVVRDPFIIDKIAPYKIDEKTSLSIYGWSMTKNLCLPTSNVVPFDFFK